MRRRMITTQVPGNNSTSLWAPYASSVTEKTNPRSWISPWQRSDRGRKAGQRDLIGLKEHEVFEELWVQRGQVVDKTSKIIPPHHEGQEEVSELWLNCEIFEESLRDETRWESRICTALERTREGKPFQESSQETRR
jgi:hypothetical protein